MLCFQCAYIVIVTHDVKSGVEFSKLRAMLVIRFWSILDIGVLD